MNEREIDSNEEQMIDYEEKMLKHPKRYQVTELDDSHGQNQYTTKIIVYQKTACLYHKMTCRKKTEGRRFKKRQIDRQNRQ